MISLREPVERTQSAFLSLVSDGVEKRTFAQAIADDLAGRRIPAAPVRQAGAVLPRSRRYLETFGDQVHMLFFEHLVRDTAATMRELYRLLDVDEEFAPALEPRAHNQFRVPRTRAVKRLARRAGGALAGACARPRADRGATTRPARSPNLTQKSVLALREAFGADVAALRKLVGRRLPKAWERQFPAQ